MDNNFRPISKEMQLRDNKRKEKEKMKKGLKTYKPLRNRTPIPKKRATPRRRDKSRTKSATGIKKPTLYQRGYFGKDYDKLYEVNGKVCGERVHRTYGEEIPPCSGGLEAHHAKFKSQGGRGTWRNGQPLCTAHHQFAHKESWYAEKWRDIKESMYGEHYYKDEWDLYKEGLIDEPTEEKFEAFMQQFEKKRN